jgi:16S rRNA processing protein RimM
MGAADGPFVILGKIVRARGLNGQVELHPYTDSPESFRRYRTLLVQMPGREMVRYGLINAYVRRGRLVVLAFSGITNREQAESLVGMEVYLEKDQLPPLPEGEYYWYQLLGLSVLDSKGENLGVLSEIVPTGAHDVYVIKAHGREILAPATAQVVKEIDLDKGIIIMDFPPGLIEANAL